MLIHKEHSVLFKLFKGTTGHFEKNTFMYFPFENKVHVKAW